jgi:putative transposase
LTQTLYNVMANAPRRLEFVFQKYDPPLYFITFNADRRRKLLADEKVHTSFVDFATTGAARDLAIGRYVIMPGHVHFFARGSHDHVLTQWIRLLQRHLSRSITVPRPHWQRGFFDHLIRRSESYSEKWEYVRQNPVRAGLVTAAEEWPYQGEIVRLEA